MLEMLSTAIHIRTGEEEGKKRVGGVVPSRKKGRGRGPRCIYPDPENSSVIVGKVPLRKMLSTAVHIRTGEEEGKKRVGGAAPGRKKGGSRGRGPRCIYPDAENSSVIVGKVPLRTSTGSKLVDPSLPPPQIAANLFDYRTAQTHRYHHVISGDHESLYVDSVAPLVNKIGTAALEGVISGGVVFIYGPGGGGRTELFDDVCQRTLQDFYALVGPSSSGDQTQEDLDGEPQPHRPADADDSSEQGTGIDVRASLLDFYNLWGVLDLFDVQEPEADAQTFQSNRSHYSSHPMSSLQPKQLVVDSPAAIDQRLMPWIRTLRNPRALNTAKAQEDHKKGSCLVLTVKLSAQVGLDDLTEEELEDAATAFPLGTLHIVRLPDSDACDNKNKLAVEFEAIANTLATIAKTEHRQEVAARQSGQTTNRSRSISPFKRSNSGSQRNYSRTGSALGNQGQSDVSHVTRLSKADLAPPAVNQHLPLRESKVLMYVQNELLPPGFVDSNGSAMGEPDAHHQGNHVVFINAVPSAPDDHRHVASACHFVSRFSVHLGRMAPDYRVNASTTSFDREPVRRQNSGPSNSSRSGSTAPPVTSAASQPSNRAPAHHEDPAISSLSAIDATSSDAAVSKHVTVTSPFRSSRSRSANQTEEGEGGVGQAASGISTRPAMGVTSPGTVIQEVHARRWANEATQGARGGGMFEPIRPEDASASTLDASTASSSVNRRAGYSKVGHWGSRPPTTSGQGRREREEAALRERGLLPSTRGDPATDSSMQTDSSTPLVRSPAGARQQRPQEESQLAATLPPSRAADIVSSPSRRLDDQLADVGRHGDLDASDVSAAVLKVDNEHLREEMSLLVDTIRRVTAERDILANDRRQRVADLEIKDSESPNRPSGDSETDGMFGPTTTTTANGAVVDMDVYNEMEQRLESLLTENLELKQDLPALLTDLRQTMQQREDARRRVAATNMELETLRNANKELRIKFDESEAARSSLERELQHQSSMRSGTDEHSTRMVTELEEEVVALKKRLQSAHEEISMLRKSQADAEAAGSEAVTAMRIEKMRLDLERQMEQQVKTQRQEWRREINKERKLRNESELKRIQLELELEEYKAKLGFLNDTCNPMVADIINQLSASGAGRVNQSGDSVEHDDYVV